METVNGEWIMLGCSEDDPERLHTVEDLQNLIHRVGFIPLFSNAVTGFSVEERTAVSDWWTEDPARDPWVWRQILSRDPEITYGKFFDRKAGFISKEWFPRMANYRRNGYDFDALCDDELVPFRNRKLMEAFEPDEKRNSLELLSFEAKQKAGFGKDGQKNYEGTLTELQMQTYLIMSDFRQKQNKKGQGYGWYIAVLETPETKWGYDYITSGYKEEPEESWKKITEQVRQFFPDAEDKALQKLLGIRYPGESPREKNGKRGKFLQLPYPDGLLTALGVDSPYSKDQIEGLQYVLEQLNMAEREVLLMRYQEHLSYQEIADKYCRSEEWIKRMHTKAIRKLKKSEWMPYYKDGYIKTLVRLEEKKEQHAAQLMEQVCDMVNDKDRNILLRLSIYDMGMTARTTNSLIQAGFDTLEDLLIMLAENPKKLQRVRNLGTVGSNEIMKKLEVYGIDIKKLATVKAYPEQ